MLTGNPNGCDLCRHRYLPDGAMRISDVQCRRFPQQPVILPAELARPATLAWRFRHEAKERAKEQP